MFCSNCGTQLPDTAKFCSKCGAQVSAPTVQSQVPSVVTPQFQQRSASHMAGRHAAPTASYGAPQYAAPQYAAPATSAMAASNATVFRAISGVLAVLALVVSFFAPAIKTDPAYLGLASAANDVSDFLTSITGTTSTSISIDLQESYSWVQLPKLGSALEQYGADPSSYVTMVMVAMVVCLAVAGIGLVLMFTRGNKIPLIIGMALTTAADLILGPLTEDASDGIFMGSSMLIFGAVLAIAAAVVTLVLKTKPQTAY